MRSTEESLETQIDIQNPQIIGTKNVNQLRSKHENHIKGEVFDLFVHGDIKILNFENLLNHERRHVTESAESHFAKDLHHIVPAEEIHDEPDVEGPVVSSFWFRSKVLSFVFEEVIVSFVRQVGVIVLQVQLVHHVKLNSLGGIAVGYDW